MSDELNPIYDAADAEFLSSLVYRSGDQFDNGAVSGVASHAITVDRATGVPVLSVRFVDSDGVTLEGEWSLALLRVSNSGGASE